MITRRSHRVLVFSFLLGDFPLHTFLQTFSGTVFDVPSFNMDAIEIVDIAHALSMQCRFGGHCIRFYSVAEHCCLVADRASDENKLSALMHDASEAYIVDLPRPIKRLLRSYQIMEDEVMSLIASKFGFRWPLPAEVKYLDTAIITDERIQNMARVDIDGIVWGNVLPGLDVDLQYWSPEKARDEFLERFYKWV